MKQKNILKKPPLFFQVLATSQVVMKVVLSNFTTYTAEGLAQLPVLQAMGDALAALSMKLDGKRLVSALAAVCLYIITHKTFVTLGTLELAQMATTLFQQFFKNANHLSIPPNLPQKIMILVVANQTAPYRPEERESEECLEWLLIECLKGIDFKKNITPEQIQQPIFAYDRNKPSLCDQRQFVVFCVVISRLQKALGALFCSMFKSFLPQLCEMLEVLRATSVKGNVMMASTASVLALRLLKQNVEDDEEMVCFTPFFANILSNNSHNTHRAFRTLQAFRPC